VTTIPGLLSTHRLQFWAFPEAGVLSKELQGERDAGEHYKSRWTKHLQRGVGFCFSVSTPGGAGPAELGLEQSTNQSNHLLYRHYYTMKTALQNKGPGLKEPCQASKQWEEISSGDSRHKNKVPGCLPPC
jgi:hypothetical protein